MPLKALLVVALAGTVPCLAAPASVTAFAAGERFSWCGMDDPFCQSGRVITNGTVGCFRIPSLVAVGESGSLVAVAEARLASCDDETNKMLAIKLSQDNGLTWGPLGFVVGSPVTRSWNPALLALPNGTVVLQYLQNRTNCPTRPGGCMAFQMASSDFGRSWSSPLALGPYLGKYANGVRPGPGKGLVLRHSKEHMGRILFSGSFSELIMPNRTHTQSIDLVWYSDNGGASYTLSDARLRLVDESSLVELANGSVLLNMRNVGASSCKCRLQSRSDDGGETWGPLVPAADLPTPQCEGSIGADPSASSLFFSNPSSTSGRVNMTVHRSDDGGTTWPHALVIDAGPSAYSCLTYLPSKADYLGVLYERGTGGPYGDLVFTAVPATF